MNPVARQPAGLVADVTLANVRGDLRICTPGAAMVPVLRAVFGGEVPRGD